MTTRRVGIPPDSRVRVEPPPGTVHPHRAVFWPDLESLLPLPSDLLHLGRIPTLWRTCGRLHHLLSRRIRRRWGRVPDMTKMIQFRVQEDEAELLKEAAWRKKMSLAGWLRRATLATAKQQMSGQQETSPTQKP